jgi:hypothetical protein
MIFVTVTVTRRKTIKPPGQIFNVSVYFQLELASPVTVLDT